MTELEKKLCNIYVLADKIVPEPTVHLYPVAVDQTHVIGYAYMIRISVLEALDELETGNCPAYNEVAIRAELDGRLIDQPGSTQERGVELIEQQDEMLDVQ